MNYVHNGLVVGDVVDGAVDGVVDGAVVGTVGGISRETNTRHYYNKMPVPIRVSVTSKTLDCIN